MRLAGNDIVDLQLAAKESNWMRKGYLQKICSEKEQMLIEESKQPNQLVWLFWSMKEAAYKVHSRKTGQRIYAPASLETTIQTLNPGYSTGFVSVENCIYHTQSKLNGEMIHSLAAPKQSLLKEIEVIISFHQNGIYPDYACTNPHSVSHHGVYLALIYL
ncbi:phosphopantetheinyl transferase [Pedobacter sp. HMWF019]|uniref:4'-phosphopantetheinyl transferase family protein n=1 Tax=Pedobacter sp. HMWF019 TaxID=2056856 RepID=UPI000D34495F|nr:4'-phosphopantetheinyl transferase superfamily protein [Pedobacter sp. HMWF019]PTS97556.1 phosphopantetheinyl transferase [Pedobacter sp. HMWF019]